MGRNKNLDERELVVAVTYVVQSLGVATANDVVEVLSQNGMNAERPDVINALERMRKRQLMSETSKIVDDKHVKAYSMRDVAFSVGVELAHLKAMLPELVTSEEADSLREVLEGKAEAGKTKKDKGRQPDITDYVMVRLDCIARSYLAGGKAGKDKEDLIFHRENGHILLNSLGIKKAFGKVMRALNTSESKADYIHLHDVRIKGKTTKMQRSVHGRASFGQATGKGVKFYEVLPIGTEFSMFLNYPTKGSVELEKFIRGCNLTPLRIGANFNEWGRTKIKGHEILGDVTQASTEKKFEKQYQDV